MLLRVRVVKALVDLLSKCRKSLTLIVGFPASLAVGESKLYRESN
jgi:hypothetical protein